MGRSRKKKQILLYLPPRLRRKLKAKAASTGKSMSSLVAEALSVRPILLTSSQIKRIARTIVRNATAPVSRIVLFGSYARGEARLTSDLDLLVVEATEPLATYRETSYLRGLLDVPVAVDLLVTTDEEWSDWKDEFGSVYYDAEQEGKVLYAR